MDLNALMEFDHCVEVRTDGTVIDAPRDVYAPDVYCDGGTDPDAEELRRAGWELLSGYTGQHGYRGPVMHPSEFIGGRMADDILDEPGIYVAVVVVDLSAGEDADDNAAGWAVARKLP